MKTSLVSVGVRALVVVAALGACGRDREAGFCAYQDTNQVVGPEFAAAVKDFFGDERGDFYWPGGRLSEQALEGLGGPPNDLERLPGGLVMGSACRAHSCTERAAVIIRCPSSVVAVGVKHFRCGAAPAGCDSVPTFTIFSAPGAPGVARARLEEWARAEAGDPAPRIQHRRPRSRSTGPPRP